MSGWSEELVRAGEEAGTPERHGRPDPSGAHGRTDAPILHDELHKCVNLIRGLLEKLRGDH
jgi:hypothetical protein